MSSNWLPTGWSTERKVDANGRTTEFYSNLETGQKFYSKNEVLRYLNVGNMNTPPRSNDTLSYTPQSVGTQLSTRSKKEHIQAVKANELPEWLPGGWMMEVKAKNSGQKYKCYTDPSSGRKFYSKPTVLQYLKSEQLDNDKSQQTEIGVDIQSREDNAVEAKESPKWLPKGWKVEYNTYKLGPRLGNAYKFYVDPLTGRKFHSKPEVLRYLNSVAQDVSSSSRKEDLSPDEYFKAVVVRTDESAEWLPGDWTVELKTNNSGRKYKYYVDPSTGRKFLSKPQVLRYLETVKSGSCNSKQKDLGLDIHSPEIIVRANEPAEWLPNGWTVELKALKSGRKCKYYVDPSTGRKFLSKPQVFQYLESMKSTDQSSELRDKPKPNVPGDIKDPNQSRSSYIQEKTRIDVPATNISVEKAGPDGLPPGWVLEIRRKKQRRDPYYTDPISGYVFRSRKDVLRYLETGEVGRLAIKPRNRNTDDSVTMTNEITPPSAAKMQEGADQVTTRQLFSEHNTGGSGTWNASPEGSVIPRVTRSSSKTNSPNDGSSICRITRASSKTGLVSTPPTETAQKKDSLKHIAANKGSSEVRTLTPPSVVDTSTRRVTRAIAKTTSVVSNLSSPRTEIITMRQVRAGSAKRKSVLAFTNESLQNKSTMDHIGQKKTEMIMPNSEGTIMKRVTRSSIKTNPDPNEELHINKLPDSTGTKDLKRKRGEKVDAKTKNASTLTNDILQEKEPMEDASENRVAAKKKPNLGGRYNKKSGKKVSGDNDYPVTKCDMSEEGKVEKQINKKVRKNSSTVNDQKLNRRSSSRLAGLGSDLMVNKKTPQVVPAKDDSEDILALNIVVDGVSQWASKQLEITPVAHEDHEVTKNPFHEESYSYNINMLFEDQPNPNEHVENMKAEKKHEGNIEISYEGNMLFGDQTIPGEHAKTLEAEEDKGDKEISNEDERPSNNSNMFLDEGNNLTENAGYLGIEKKGDEILESQTSFAFDSWPDPCLEFAFKTLTGALPVEDNPEINGYFHQETETSQIQKDGGLCVHNTPLTTSLSHCDTGVIPVVSEASPIEESLNIQDYFQMQYNTNIQIDTSSHCDAPVTPVLGQQIPLNPAVPSNNVNYQVGPQQPSSEQNNNKH